MKILILGHTGMLGHMVQKYLNKFDYEISTTTHRWPSNELKLLIKNYDGDYIINCIGAIHQRTKNFEVNWELPIYLDVSSNCRVIHPGTDCEMDLDEYGTSKRISKNFIINDGVRTKSITTSILGPELNTNFSLMGWFLSQKKGTTLNGYSKYMWNGNTTLTWSKYCNDLILNWEKYNNDTILSSECVSKKEILDSLNEVFNRENKIINDDSVVFNKCLFSDYVTPHIKKQIMELKEFYYGSN